MLRNKYGLHNRAALTQREYDATSKREVQLVIGQVKLPQTRDAAHLKVVHRILFQDVYEWAGEYRTVNMEKVGARSSTTGTLTSGWCSHVSRSEQRSGAASITDSSLLPPPPPVSR